MADFSTFNDFRKGYSLDKNNQYADPTYLSFSIMFDFVDPYNSPLLAGSARTFLIENTDAKGKDFKGTEEVEEETNDEGEVTTAKAAGTPSHNKYDGEYGHRLKALDDFILTLRKINREMPWYWQSLGGVDALQKYDPLKPYRGGDESKLTIGTLESLDLTIAGLMYLYRTAVFDEKKWSYVLPTNLRKFRIWIYVTEVRPIKNLSKISASLGFDKDALKGAISGGGQKIGDVFDPSFGVFNANADISGSDSRPFFFFELGSCEWDMTTGTAQFADLQKTPEGFAASEIAFSYEKIGKVSARVLNGTIVETDKQAAEVSPATEAESKTYQPGEFKDFIGDKIMDKLSGIGDRVVDDAALFMEKKKQQIGQLGSDIYRANVPNFENIYTNMVAKADKDTDISTLSANMPENVLGLKKDSTVKDGFDQSATAGLNIGENVNADANTNNSGTSGDNNLGNIHDE
jgi:hypothetical protein